MQTRTILILANIVYLAVLALFLMDGFTSFNIKSQLIKYFVYLGLFIGAPAILIGNAISFQPVYKRILSLILPILALILIFFIGPLEIVFAAGAWRTQTVIYQNIRSSFNKVEFQMRGRGALGYNRRTVEVLYLTPLFMVIRPVPRDIDTDVEWIKVDKEVNELGLK
ncbi:hypothetical protein V9K67_23245 [Paraflavisolibacter sp. H34]|uniref:hypothetical protein n=1 Tax=Huijunlia imazamoxiresistens TaxID=3127457 RepID=UPI003017BFB7